METWMLERRSKNTRVIYLVRESNWEGWLEKAPDLWRAWLRQTDVSGKAGCYALLPSAKGDFGAVVAVVADKPDLWGIAGLQRSLPKSRYVLEGDAFSAEEYENLLLGWLLAAYRFDRFKSNAASDGEEMSRLVWPDGVHRERVIAQVEAIWMVRDLINRPANDLTPLALAAEARKLSKTYGGSCRVIEGDALLEANYPLIHAVGRASSNKPCLIDLRWGKQSAPLVTLVGKGICFDSGGLDIKPSNAMLLMKKDMGGAANVLGLARMIMALDLPVKLHVLIPAAENSVSANAFRPMDIITSRKGLTVEIGNTDAEGRLVLCDALHEADRRKPDLLIDCATLTGAARVALGTELPAFFTPDDDLAREIDRHSAAHHDALWRLPLWRGYDAQLKSDAADLNNAPGGGYAGAITAALYLQRFIEHTERWVHVDMMAWNLAARPGRPVGGEAMAIRALFRLIESRYSKATKKPRAAAGTREKR